MRKQQRVMLICNDRDNSITVNYRERMKVHTRRYSKADYIKVCNRTFNQNHIFYQGYSRGVWILERE